MSNRKIREVMTEFASGPSLAALALGVSVMMIVVAVEDRNLIEFALSVVFTLFISWFLWTELCDEVERKHPVRLGGGEEDV